MIFPKFSTVPKFFIDCSLEEVDVFFKIKMDKIFPAILLRNS